MIVESSNEFHVEHDIMQLEETGWQWTTSGVSVVVPKELADSCEGMVIDASGGQLVIRPAHTNAAGDS